MSVVTFIDYTPTARFDGNPWTHARIEGAADSAGPWEELETVALDPVDTDPERPQARGFTTELVTDETWFRIVFVDADGDESATSAVAKDPQPTWRPRVADVGAVIRAYTRSDVSGGTAGTFDSGTAPTRTEVEEFISHAVFEMALRLPDDLDAETENFARRLAAIRAAMLVIVSLQSDQDTSEDSAYDRLKDLYDEGWAALRDVAGQTDGTGVTVSSVPLTSPFSGPEPVSELDFAEFQP